MMMMIERRESSMSADPDPGATINAYRKATNGEDITPQRAALLASRIITTYASGQLTNPTGFVIAKIGELTHDALHQLAYGGDPPPGKPRYAPTPAERDLDRRIADVMEDRLSMPGHRQTIADHQAGTIREDLARQGITDPGEVIAWLTNRDRLDVPPARPDKDRRYPPVADALGAAVYAQRRADIIAAYARTANRVPPPGPADDEPEPPY